MSITPHQIAVDHAKLQRMLGSPELAWLVDRIRGRLERGEPIDGTVTLVGATPTQRRAAARLLGRNVGRGTSLSVPLPAVAAELWRAAAAPDLVSAVEALRGPVRNLAAERAAGLKRWGDALAEVRASWLSQYAWYREWLDAIGRDGTVTRLIRQGQANVIGHAVAVLERLPNGPEPGTAVLATLADAATGNDRALADGPLAGLVLRALAAREGVAVPSSREAEQALWSAAGVVADDLASSVLVLKPAVWRRARRPLAKRGSRSGLAVPANAQADHGGAGAALGAGDLRLLEQCPDCRGCRPAWPRLPGARLYREGAVGGLRSVA